MLYLACVVAAVVAGLLVFVGVPRRRPAAGWEKRQRARIRCPWCLERVRVADRTCEHCLRPLVQPSMSMTRR
jgi:hypothetical protein